MSEHKTQETYACTCNALPIQIPCPAVEHDAVREAVVCSGVCTGCAACWAGRVDALRGEIVHLTQRCDQLAAQRDKAAREREEMAAALRLGYPYLPHDGKCKDGSGNKDCPSCKASRAIENA